MHRSEPDSYPQEFLKDVELNSLFHQEGLQVLLLLDAGRFWRLSY